MSNQLMIASKATSFNPNLIIITYRWLATATVVLLAILEIKQIPYFIIAFLCAYNAASSYYLLKMSSNLKRKLLIVVIDFILCSSLLFGSGSWASPYFQYGLGFLILSALLLGFLGAGLSLTLYGITYFIGLNLNGHTLNRIIEKGYLGSLITDYAIFIAVSVTCALIAKVAENSNARAQALRDSLSGSDLPSALPVFSPQQAEIMRLLVDGLTNDQIASELGITVSDVRRHLKNLYCQLGVKGRIEAIRGLMYDASKRG